jgi:formylglycine-generating enzyme required for sulfatase activity
MRPPRETLTSSREVTIAPRTSETPPVQELTKRDQPEPKGEAPPPKSNPEPSVREPPRVPAALHLQPVAPVRLHVGQSITVMVHFRRDNCPEPVELRVEGLPPGVQTRPTAVLGEADAGAVPLTATVSAADADGPVRLVAVVGDVRAESTFQLKVVRRRPDTAPEIVNSLGMPLVRIPAGQFRMGSPNDAGHKEDERPQHPVEITQPFYLGKHEVTRGQFRQFVDANRYTTVAQRDGHGVVSFDARGKSARNRVGELDWLNCGFDQTDEHPVVTVSWIDAQAFCQWLSRKEGQTYRLPTEAEWEYACRAGTTTRFSSGDAESSLRGVANIADQSLKRKWDYSNLNKVAKSLVAEWFKRVSWDDGYPFTAPVGNFAANAFGLCDMHGNVWEWCQDCYDKDYYKNSPSRDPQGPATTGFRVVRGGSFYNVPQQCRAASRDYHQMGYCANFVGFRVVREP